MKAKPVSGFWMGFPYLTWTVWGFKTNKQSSEDTPGDTLLTWQENPWGNTLQDASQCFARTQRPVTGGYGLFTDQLQRLQQTEKQLIFRAHKINIQAVPAINVTHPSFDRLPLCPSVAHVSENPHDDDAGLEICDSGLKEQFQCRHEEHLSQTAVQTFLWWEDQNMLYLTKKCMLLF